MCRHVHAVIVAAAAIAGTIHSVAGTIHSIAGTIHSIAGTGRMGSERLRVSGGGCGGVRGAEPCGMTQRHSEPDHLWRGAEGEASTLTLTLTLTLGAKREASRHVAAHLGVRVG